ncbi:MAG: hypothetical protein LBR53_06710 [Deltaproteobacteria bacterium]|jgi:hypothetical protein|nr:hypothetical protein [Deltaproteobacteria bacterium]
MRFKPAFRFPGPLRATSLVLSALFFSLVLFTGSALAQPGEDPDYQYPTLTEGDFQFFIKFMNFLETHDESEVHTLYKENNLTEEQAQLVVLKISVNTLGKLMDNTDEIVKEFGPSVLFSPAEEALYAKYETRLSDAISRLGSKM